jgi:hypothetical protein
MQKRLLITVLGATAILTLVACGGTKKSDAPARLQPTFVINNGLSATGGAPSGGQASGNDLGAMADSFAKVKSYRATYLLESPGAPAQEGKMEVVAPDKNHMTFGALEIIKIGSDSYYKIGPTWTKTAAAGSNTPGFDADSVGRTMSNLKSSGAVKGATATVNGKTCQLYTFTSGTPTAGTPASSYETCIADNLPLRVVSQSGGTKTTITFSDYNANIEIKAPI